MSTPYKFIALRRLNVAAQQCRHLHMTDPATYSSQLFANGSKMARNARPISQLELEKQSQAGRAFNTSRSLKQNKDSSTMDFAYMPGVDVDAASSGMVKMPRLTANDAASGLQESERVSMVAKPEISTASLDTKLSPLSDVHDNNAVQIEFHKVVDQVNAAATKAMSQAQALTANSRSGESGTVRSLWNGVVEDLMGSKRSRAA